jgi:hypothetical protein
VTVTKVEFFPGAEVIWVSGGNANEPCRNNASFPPQIDQEISIPITTLAPGELVLEPGMNTDVLFDNVVSMDEDAHNACQGVTFTGGLQLTVTNWDE